MWHVTFYFPDGWNYTIRGALSVCETHLENWEQARREQQAFILRDRSAAQPPAAQRRMVVDLGVAYRAEIKPGA